MKLRDANVIIFQGMKRSGNHAVIDWLMDSTDYLRHYNNVFPISHELQSPGTFKFPMPLEPLIRQHKNIFDFVRTGQRALLSIEDYEFRRDFFLEAPHVLFVLLVRSAENLFSSRIRKAFTINRLAYPRELNSTMQRAIDIWVDHVDKFICNSISKDFVGIYYDKWIGDAQYRAVVTARFGLKCDAAPRSTKTRIVRRGGRLRLGLRTRTGSSSFVSLPNATADELLNRKLCLSNVERNLLDTVLSDSRVLSAQKRLDDFIGIARRATPTGVAAVDAV